VAPRRIVLTTRPVMTLPSNGVHFCLWAISSPRTTHARSGSKTTISASEPIAIVPLRGYRPNMRAGVVLHSSTQRSLVNLPVTTPW
jgi:hypothetical protein